MKPVIGIIGGQGKMGAHFASFFRERGFNVKISDLRTKLTNAELAATCDIVFVSVPIPHTVDVIEGIRGRLRAEAALMDLTSLKEEPLKAMLKANCEVTGLHPMFGSSNPIPGQTIIFCETPKSGKWTKYLKKIFTDCNVHIEQMSAKEHDKMMNIAQGLIHFAEITFADTLKELKIPIRDLIKYTGRASELKVQLAARIIHQDPDLYANIQIRNPYTIQAVKTYQKSIAKFLSVIEKKDLPAFKNNFSKIKDFLGPYSQEAFLESTFLIDKMLENRRPKAKTIKQKLTTTSLATLGPPHTFSDQAASAYQKNNPSLTKYFANSIGEVIDLVASKKAKIGIIPIENKLHGTVRESLDGLFSAPVQIVDKLTIPIHHCLVIAADSDLKQIKKVSSHQQAIQQCQKYLKKNLPKAKTEETTSTAAALQELITSGNKTLAVIAPKAAVQDPNLKIIAENIEDDPTNETSFVLIKHQDQTLESKQNPQNSAIAFYFNQDKPGTLASVFNHFAKSKINLTRIESRPTRKEFGDYIFFLDFNAPLKDKRLEKIFAALKKEGATIKTLGEY